MGYATREDWITFNEVAEQYYLSKHDMKVVSQKFDNEISDPRTKSYDLAHRLCAEQERKF